MNVLVSITCHTAACGGFYIIRRATDSKGARPEPRYLKEVRCITGRSPTRRECADRTNLDAPSYLFTWRQGAGISSHG